MQVTITAVGPDNRGLADPIIHYVSGVGANIAEIQMYDHDEEKIFAMVLRVDWPETRVSIATLRQEMTAIGQAKGLKVRTWAPAEHQRKPRLALCSTIRQEPVQAVLEAVKSGHLNADPVVVIGNRPHCEALAKAHGLDWHLIGDAQGRPDNDKLAELFDRYEIDYIILARYMRLIPAALCWQFAGGRIINLHHGLLPAFPGRTPYHDAYARRMLSYGATVHYIIPELDAGDQIIHQDTFVVRPGTPLEDNIRTGEGAHEPKCLVEGLRRVVDGEVVLRFHKVKPRRTP
jgi:formyltetrahydrofolate deformylase